MAGNLVLIPINARIAHHSEKKGIDNLSGVTSVEHFMQWPALIFAGMVLVFLGILATVALLDMRND